MPHLAVEIRGLLWPDAYLGADDEFFGAALPVRSNVALALAQGVDVEIEVQAFVGDS